MLDCVTLAASPDAPSKPLLCLPHLNVLRMLMWHSPFVDKVLIQGYGLPNSIHLILAAKCLLDPVCGLKGIAKFFYEVIERFHEGVEYADAASCCILIVNGAMTACDHESYSNHVLAQSHSQHAEISMQMFNELDPKLTDGLNKDKDHFGIENRKNLPRFLSEFLRRMMNRDEQIAFNLFGDIVGESEREHISPASYASVACCAWKIKLWNRYICSNRMELRVAGANQMAADLVSFYNEYPTPENDGEIRHSSITVEFECIAQILVKEKVIDYLVGVSSHPAIIGHSGNIIGFVVIANKFTTEKADLVWETLVQSEDHRTVHALLSALTHIVKTLTTLEEDLYLCEKLIAQPLMNLESHAQYFIDTLFNKIKNRIESVARFDEYKRTLIQVCIHTLRHCAEVVPSTPFARQIQQEATLTLSCVGGFISKNMRETTYRDWTSRIEQRDPHAASYVQAMYSIVVLHPEDLSWLIETLDLVRICIQSFVRMVQIWKSRDTAQRSDLLKEKEDLQYSLLLISWVSQHNAEAAEPDVWISFWGHLVGQDALNNEMREWAWAPLTKLALQKNHGAVMSLSKLYLPSLQPENFTGAFVNFVEQFTKAKIDDAEPSQISPENILQLPGVDLIWRVILTAPDKTGVNNAMKFLAGLWADILLERLTGESLETNHKVIARLCIKRMNDAYNFIRSQSSATTSAHGNDDLDVMDTEDAEKLHYEERAFCRCVLFLRTLTATIRQHPSLLRPMPVPPSPELKESSHINGEALTIKFQLYPKAGKSSNQIQERIVGDLDTRKELHDRVRRWSGFSKFGLIWGGRFIKLLDNPMESLRDLKIGNLGLMIIKENAESEQLPPSPHSRMADSVFDAEIVSNFDNFYRFMDSEDRISNAVFDFLKCYQPHESICQLVADRNGDPEIIFPSNRVFAINYSIKCLRKLVDDELKKITRDGDQLQHLITLLEWLIINRPLPVDHPAVFNKYVATQQLSVNTLVSLMKSLGEFDKSPFKDGKAVVERLLDVIKRYLQSPTTGQITHEAYELLLYVVLACPDAWDRFKAEDVKHLHTSLLLANPNPGLRGSIMSIIKTMISRFKISNSHLQKEDLVSHFWSLVSGIIPQTPTYWRFAGELFGLSEFLFRIEFCFSACTVKEEDFDRLDSYWEEWSQILCRYNKEEFVGRETTDAVICGCSVLLTMVFQLLKSANKPPESEDLADRLWFELLFPRTAMEDSRSIEFDIPLLDSRTRTSVYMLLTEITIKYDDFGFQKAAEWIERVSFDRPDEPQRNLVDRTRIIRPETGYLGLRNLGNTCYMNSLLTQLYMNPGFRSFLIRQPSSERRQTLLYESQLLFSRMQNGYGPYGDPGYVARNIRTYFDEAINVAEQMDVEEFFNLLFDQLENQLESSTAKEEFRSFYGGKLVNQIKSKECEHVSENEERYLNLQCDVQGKDTLHQSLQALVEGDVMQGDNKYKCEKCGGKFVNAVRRARLKETPDNLILHLKRFEYDIAQQRRNKINDYFEFPSTIDMSPYQIDHLKDDAEEKGPDVFELVGVLVHRGTAEHGHYVSYIRARPSFEGTPPIWLLFDDSEVTPFNYSDIGEHCFGGLTTRDHNYNPLQPFKINNAYMLFYQRSSTLRNSNIPAALVGSENSGMAMIPELISNQINQENSLALRNYCLFGEPHSQFVKELALGLKNAKHNLADHPDYLKTAIHAILQHIWRVSSRTKDIPDLAEKLEILQHTISECSLCGLLTFSWFAQHIPEFRDIVARSSMPKVRKEVQEFIITALSSMRDTECYGIAIDSSEFPSVEEPGKGAFIMFIETALIMITRNELAYNVRGFDEFFNMLWKIATLGDQETVFMIMSGYFTVCLHFLVLHRDESVRRKYPRTVFFLEKRAVIFNSLTSLFAHLLERLNVMDFVATDAERHYTYDTETKKFHITREERRCLSMFDGGLIWMLRMFEKWDTGHKETKDSALRDIVAYITSEDDRGEFYQDRMYTTISDCISNQISPESDLYVKASQGLIKHTYNQTYVRQIIKDVNQLLTENDAPGAQQLYDFYNFLRTVRNKHHEPPESGFGSFYKETIQFAHIFAPVLLTHTDGELIRYQTQNLIEEILLSLPPIADMDFGPTSLEIYRADRIRMVFFQCANKNRVLLEQEYGKRNIQPIMQILKGCADWIQKLHESDEYEPLRHTTKDQEILESYQSKY